MTIEFTALDLAQRRAWNDYLRVPQGSEAAETVKRAAPAAPFKLPGVFVESSDVFPTVRIAETGEKPLSLPFVGWIRDGCAHKIDPKAVAERFFQALARSGVAIVQRKCEIFEVFVSFDEDGEAHTDQTSLTTVTL